MKHVYSFVLLCFSTLSLIAQVQNPVNWKAEYKKSSSTQGEIIITANIDMGWHTYSQRPTDAGPIPTSFTFTPSKSFTLIGKPEETEAHEEFVPAFEAKIFVFKEKAVFKQKVDVIDQTGALAQVKVEYMTCNDMMCLPPKTVELTVKIQ